MQNAPFLVTYGGLLWKVIVAFAASVSIALSARKAYRNRSLSTTADQWPLQIVFALFRAALVSVAVVLLLVATGRIALRVAGEKPFENRADDHVSQLNPVVIASATPFVRDRALETFAQAGFELEVTCETRLAHGQLDELIAHADQCFAPAYWKAYAQLISGQPCDAFATLSKVDPARSRDSADLKLLVLASIGCRRWPVVAAAAQQLTNLGADASWKCIADAAAVRSGVQPTRYLAETQNCFPLFVATAPRSEAEKRVQDWAAKPTAERPPRLLSITAIQYAPALFRDIRTLDFLAPMAPESLVDVLVEHTNELELLVPTFANLVLAAGAADIGPAARVEWLKAAAISDVIAGNFGHARELVAEIDRTAQSMKSDEAGPRDGSLEWSRKQSARLEQLLKYRLGEGPLQDVEVLGEITKACFALRQGEFPNNELSKDAVPIAKALLSNDYAPLARAIRRRVVPFALPQFIGAIAPRLRPVPSDLIAFTDTPRWSILSAPSPGAIASDAAGRRDVLRLLGEQKRADRWAEIARRQWQLATDPELAVFYALIAEAHL